MQIFLNIFILFVILFLILAGARTFQDILRDMRKNKYILIPFLLCSITAFAQQDTTFRKQPAKHNYLQATLDPPTEDIPEHFEFVSPIFIEVSQYDTIFKQKATVFVNQYEFFLITGHDTLSRRICNYQYNYMELKLSCGDWIKPVRDFDGEVYALWYREGSKKYYFSTKWRKLNE